MVSTSFVLVFAPRLHHTARMSGLDALMARIKPRALGESNRMWTNTDVITYLDVYQATEGTFVVARRLLLSNTYSWARALSLILFHS
jgi:hypothetical protein